MLLANREIRRARLRFALLSGAVGLLVYLILFQQLLLGGLLQSFTSALDAQDGTVLVYSSAARKNVEGSVLTPDTVEAVRRVEGVAAAGRIGQGTFTVVSEAPGKSAEQVEASVFGFETGLPGAPTRIVQGVAPSDVNEAIASQEDVAKGFGLGATVRTEAGGVPLRIVGLTENSRFSVAPTLWVTYPTYEGLRRAANPDATAVFPTLVAAQPTEGVSPTEASTRVTAQVSGVQALTRSQAVTEAPGVAAVQQSFSIILGLAFVVVTLVIGFFFLILTTQKASSLTLLRAMGAPSGYLVRNLVVQILAVVGVGIALALALLVGSTRSGGGSLPLTINPTTVARTSTAIVVLALAGSLVSIRRVLRLDPHDVVSRQSLGGLG